MCDYLRAHRNLLRQTCSRVLSPHPYEYKAFEKTYKLPKRFKGKEEAEKRKLLGMYFAVHGCLQISSACNNQYLSPALFLSKKAAFCDILHLFGENLGGSILPSSGRVSLLAQPQCTWALWGQKAVSAAQLLSDFRSPLQAKLKLFSAEGWPKENERRQELKKQLNMTPWDLEAPLEIDSLEDVAHLFDVSSSFHIQGAKSNRVHIFLSCPTNHDWESVNRVLGLELGSSMKGGFYRPSRSSLNSRASCIWTLSSQRKVKDLLQALEDKVLLKKKEMQLALTLSSSSETDNLSRWYQGKNLEWRHSARLSPDYRRLMRNLRSLDSQIFRDPSNVKKLDEREAVREHIQEMRLQEEIKVLEHLLALNRVEIGKEIKLEMHTV